MKISISIGSAYYNGEDWDDLWNTHKKRTNWELIRLGRPKLGYGCNSSFSLSRCED